MSPSSALTISELSDATGVKTVTLRAWERRHGLLKPRRTAGGHRFYRQADVARVQAIRAWLEQGVSVGQVGPLLDGDLPESPGQLDVQPAVQACLGFNARHLEQIFNQIARERSVASLYRHWMLPLRDALREHAGGVALAFCDRFLAQKLAARTLKHARQLSRTPQVLVQCPGTLDGDPVAAVCQLLALEQGWPTLLFQQALSGSSLAASALADSLTLRVLVLTPSVRQSDLRVCLRGSERLGCRHSLLVTRPGQPLLPGTRGWPVYSDPVSLLESWSGEVVT